MLRQSRSLLRVCGSWVPRSESLQLQQQRRLLGASVQSPASPYAAPSLVVSSSIFGASSRFVHSTSACCSSPYKKHSSSSSSSVRVTKTTPIEIERVLSHLEIMEKWSCSGCGIELQYEDPSKVGYFPKQLLNNITHIKDLKKLRCERCFQMTQYGKISDTKMPYQEYEKRVMELRAKDMLMIQLVDILDISGSLLPKARHVFGKKPVMLVVNKGDLIPEKSGIRRLMRRIRSEAKEAGIENIIAIYLISAMKGIGMKEIIEDVKKHRKGRDLCVVGAANVGKSTFLNSFMKFLVDRKWQHNHRKYMKLPEVSMHDLKDDESIAMLNIDDDTLAESESRQKQEDAGEESNASAVKKSAKVITDRLLFEGEDPEMLDDAEQEDREMTTSPLPGTTLAVQYLPVVSNNELFNILDTPGLITDSKRQKLIEVLALDGSAKLKNVFPTKQLPATTYRIEPGRSLFLGALARFDYESMGGHNDKSMLLLTWYGVLPGHLTKTATAEETYLKHAGGLLSPPRGLDALSFTGPLAHSQNVYLKDYITVDVKTKSKHASKPKRTTVVELELPGFGWLSVTAVDLDGTAAAEQTLSEGKISVSTCRGLTVSPRAPIFPFEMSTSKKPAVFDTGPTVIATAASIDSSSLEDVPAALRIGGGHDADELYNA